MALQQTRKDLKNKRRQFRRRGKKPFQADSRIGAIPQDIYDQHRHPSDPDYKPRKEA